MVNGIDELAVTNIDGLDTLDRIRVWLETIARDAAARSATTRTAPTTATQLRLVHTNEEAS